MEGKVKSNGGGTGEDDEAVLIEGESGGLDNESLLGVDDDCASFVVLTAKELLTIVVVACAVALTAFAIAAMTGAATGGGAPTFLFFSSIFLLVRSVVLLNFVGCFIVFGVQIW